MKRILKDPEIRRAEIIAHAQHLFEKIGYEKTSVETIIKAAGIAKGTFYYYFKTKKDILQAIVEEVGNKLIVYFKSIVENQHMSSIDKFKTMLLSPKKRKLTDSLTMQLIHKPENRELQEQLNIQSINLIAPLMTDVLIQGYHEGYFKKRASLEMIQLMLAGTHFVLESGLFNWSPKKNILFVESLQTFLEQHVGAKPGILDFISAEFK